MKYILCLTAAFAHASERTGYDTSGALQFMIQQAGHKEQVRLEYFLDWAQYMAQLE